MAAAQFVKPPQYAQRDYGESYPTIPSSGASVVNKAGTRVNLLAKWIKDKRYRLTPEEKAQLAAHNRIENCCLVGAVSTVCTAWWITGKSTPDHLLSKVPQVSDWIKNMQRYKVGPYSVPQRIALCLGIQLVSETISAKYEDDYFMKTTESPTVYGGFARYILQQGDNIENGLPTEKYMPGGVYLKKKLDEKRKSSWGDENATMMRDEVEIPSAPPASALPSAPATTTATAIREPDDDATIYNDIDTTKPAAPEADVTKAQRAAMRLPRPSSNDPTTAFLDHVFGSPPPRDPMVF